MKVIPCGKWVVLLASLQGGTLFLNAQIPAPAGTNNATSVAPATAESKLADSIDIPSLDGDWWKIADQKPDLGQWTDEKEDACDFTIFQAADGTWQLIGCVRYTKWPTGTRIFHRWEAKNLTDTNWTPKGVFLLPDKSLSQVTAIQAPYCLKWNGKFYLFYNAGTTFGKNPDKALGTAAYCMVSDDGKNFKTMQSIKNEPWFFPMGRDVYLLHDDAQNRWIAYYAGKDDMMCRTSPALEGLWSETETHLQVKTNPESPFVIKRGEAFYLWSQMNVYRSTDPTVFSDPPVTAMADGGRDPRMRYAPELVESNGQWYIAGYNRGIFLCKMKWESRPMTDITAWREGKWLKLQDDQKPKTAK